MFAGFFYGVNYIKSGFALTQKPGLKRYVFIPLIINIFVFIGLAWWTTAWFDQLISSLSWLDGDSEGWLGWIIEKFRTVLWVLFSIFALIVFAYTFSLVANLLAAPFNSLLAERCETYLIQGSINAKDESLVNTFKRLPKVLASELAKILYLIKWMIPILFIYLIPFVNVAAPFISLAFGAWIFALEYVDYPMGNRGFLFKQIHRKLRGRRNLALGFGGAITLLMAIPVINLFVMPAAVCGATKLYVDEISDTQLNTSTL